MKSYSVYILTNKFKNVLYIGVTNNLERRISEHKNQLIPGFTQKYKINALVYYEDFADINDAIAREKQIKSYRREKKNKLIEGDNPTWKDISLEWGIVFGDPSPPTGDSG